jgi:hypothetical protein
MAVIDWLKKVSAEISDFMLKKFRVKLVSSSEKGTIYTHDRVNSAAENLPKIIDHTNLLSLET